MNKDELLRQQHDYCERVTSKESQLRRFGSAMEQNRAAQIKQVNKALEPAREMFLKSLEAKRRKRGILESIRLMPKSRLKVFAANFMECIH